MSEIRDKISNARLGLMTKHKFWGYLAMQLVFIEREDGGGQRTTAVDDKGNFYYNKEWIENMSHNDLIFEIGHELMHIVQKCMARFPAGGNFAAWNLAADYLADTYLIGDGKNGIPQSSISAKMVNKEIQDWVRPKVIEEVYKELLKKDEEENKGKNKRECKSGSSGCGKKKKGESGKEEGSFGDEAKLKWTQKLLSAEKVCKEANKQGSIPGNIQDFLLKLRQPTVNWKDMIRTSATSRFKGRYTFKQPNRRAHALGVRLQRRKPTPEGAALFFDTSGSMSKKELVQSASEAVGILNACGAAFAHVFFHDVNCYYHAKYTKHEMTKLKVTRGGTSHRDVFSKAIEELDNIGMVVAFTDLETSFPDEEPEFPVLWCVAPAYAGHSKPWGKTVVMHPEE